MVTCFCFFFQKKKNNSGRNNLGSPELFQNSVFPFPKLRLGTGKDRRFYINGCCKMFLMKKGKQLNLKKVNRKSSGKLLILLISFLFGNLFGINFSGINWNFCLIFFIVLFFECLNFFISRNFKQFVTKTLKTLGQYFQLKEKNQLAIPQNKFFFTNSPTLNFTGIQTIKNVLESFRRGFFLGIFVEAFKVGS